MFVGEHYQISANRLEFTDQSFHFQGSIPSTGNKVLSPLRPDSLYGHAHCPIYWTPKDLSYEVQKQENEGEH
jgi:hypothetical protein